MKSHYMPVFQNPQLKGKSIYWPGNATGVLLIHGFTATTAEVRLLADAFKKQGLTVSAPLLPGHGTSPQDRTGSIILIGPPVLNPLIKNCAKPAAK
jgi:Esterase/lipase